MSRIRSVVRTVPTPRPVARQPDLVEYPSEGIRVPQSDQHDRCGHYCGGALRVHYRHWRDVYVAHDKFIYLKKGEPEESVAADILVAFGVEDRLRASYKMWEEPKAPDFVLEILSPSTFRRDLGRKRRLYRRLGVREYWVHDPSGKLRAPRLAGWRLPAHEAIAADEDGRLPSAALGLSLCLRDGELRFYDPATRRYLLSQEEEAAERRREAAGRQREAAVRAETQRRLAQTEARNAELEARLRVMQAQREP